MRLVNVGANAFASRMSGAIYFAGLGDVIRICYQNAAYRAISEAQTPVPVIVASHNPFAIEIFRHHRNAKNFILYELGHKYEEYLAAGLRGVDINRAICDFAGVDYDKIPHGSSKGYVPIFDAPDEVASTGHIVFQPFAGNASYRSLPPELMEKTVDVLRRLPWPVYVITRSYPRLGAKGHEIHGGEDARALAGGNITVLEDLTVPATLNLIKNCRAYVGSWSSLQQAAWFENKPVAVLYPADLHPRGKGYDFGIDREETLARDFGAVDVAELEAFFRKWGGDGA